MKPHKLIAILLTALLLAMLAGVSTATICNCLMMICLNLIPLREGLLITSVGSIGLIAMLWQLWRTTRYTCQLLQCSQVPLSSDLNTQIRQWGLHTSHMALIQSAEPLAFCFGFLKPRICLSTGFVRLLPEAQLRAALLHEDYHRQQFDPLRLLLVDTLSTALFFLPVVREWRTLFKIKLELKADRYAAQTVGKAHLAGALHRVLSYAPVAPLSDKLVLPLCSMNLLFPLAFPLPVYSQASVLSPSSASYSCASNRQHPYHLFHQVLI